MTEFFSEEQVLSKVSGLTRARLVSFVEAEVIWPVIGESGAAYRRVDLARLELLCDMAEGFELEGDALGVVMSLIDQLHDSRTELRALMTAIAAEPPDVQARIAAVLRDV